jgi:hypothetical protein
MCVHIRFFILLHVISLSFCIGIYDLKIVKCKILNLIETASQTHYVCIILQSRCHILLRLRFVLRSVYKPSSYDIRSYLIVPQSLLRTTT